MGYRRHDGMTTPGSGSRGDGGGVYSEDERGYYGDMAPNGDPASYLQSRSAGYSGDPLTMSLANILSTKMPQGLQLEDLQAIEQALAGDSLFNSSGLSQAYRNKVAGRNSMTAGLSSGKDESRPTMSSGSRGGGWRTEGPAELPARVVKEDPIEKQMRLLALDNAKLENQQQHKTLGDRTSANLPMVLKSLLRRLYA